jgi:FkbM family methyltransferase
MKAMVQAAARSVGIDILSLSYSRDYIYTHHLKEMLDRHRIETVLDIGANIGGYGIDLRKIGYKGTIHSFEPVTAPFKILQAKAAEDPKWHVHQYAFGDADTTADINVMAGSELCSFLTPDGGGPRMTVEGIETVQVRRLDSFTEPLDWSRTFVKIDTQGHDIAVMRGGTETLRKVPLIQSEVSFRPIYQGMPDFSQAIAHMKSLGFDVTGLFPVSRDNHRRVVEFDCMAVNSALLG